MTLILAMLLDAALGEPRFLWSRLTHPAVLMGRMISEMERRFNRGLHRKTSGTAVLLVLVVGAGAVGALLSTLGPVVEILVAAILFAQKSLADHVRAVADGLRMSLPEGRRAVAQIVSRDTHELTPSDAARAAIESAAENMSDGVIAPIFWFAIAGLPGLLVYKIVNTADSMIGYKTDRYRDFGWAAARFDDLLNLVPARLTAALFGISGGVFAMADIRRDAARHKSPNAGWPEAALARALGIALAGPRIYHGEKTKFDWVNPEGRQTLSPKDIDAAVCKLWQVWSITLGTSLLHSMLF